MPDVSPKERIMLLQENASKVEQTTYQKQLTPEELIERRENLSDVCIKLDQAEDEFQEVKDDHKARMTPMKTLRKGLLTQIKTKQTSVTGVLYHLANHDDGMMETYDSDGFLIESRRLRPEEKQGTMFKMMGKVAE